MNEAFSKQGVPGAVPFLCALFLAALLAGCQTTIVNGEDTEVEELTEEERIQNDIEILIDALALPRPQVGAVCSRLVEHGKRAVPELARNLDNRIPIIRVCSIYCLGQIYIAEKLQSVRDLAPKVQQRLTFDPDMRVRLEASTFLCHLGDYRGVNLLLAALRNESAYVRMTANQALCAIFDQDFGFDHTAPEAQRERVIGLWEQWWRDNRAAYRQPAETR
jgi:HEAT repeat protein